MKMSRRRHFALAALLVVLLPACKGKEQAAPAETQPPATSAAPTTTTTTTLPPPPKVWRAAHWGMTKDELLAAFPGEAQRLPKPARFAAQEAATSDVAIPSFDADSVTWRALFGFEPGTLDRIRLDAAKPGPGTCEDVEKALTARHGPPAERHATGTSLRGEEITWKLPDQAITLSCTGVASLGFLTVSIDYRPPAVAAAVPAAAPAAR